MGQNLVPLVNIKIAGKWMFIPLKWYVQVLIHSHIYILINLYLEMEVEANNPGVYVTHINGSKS